MNERDLHIDLIEKYLDDNLNKEETTLFNETLENNEEFIRELNDMELLIAGIRHSAATTTFEEKIARFESSLKIIQKGEDDSDKTLSFFDFEHIKKYSWAIAASITLLMVCTVSIFKIHQPPSNQKVYATYFKPFENYGSKRAAVNGAKDYWKDALYYYDNGMYQEALDRFDRIILSDYKQLVNHPRYSLYKLYKGNTLMKLNKHQEAILLFEGILQDGDGMIMQAKWYLSMCYLYNDNSEKLLPLLEDISQVESSSYGRDAKEILDKLN